jgi:hypothetical protein
MVYQGIASNFASLINGSRAGITVIYKTKPGLANT